MSEYPYPVASYTDRASAAAVARAGGEERLRKIAEKIAGSEWKIEFVEGSSPNGAFYALVLSRRSGLFSRPYETLVESLVPSSAAVRSDVETRYFEDRAALDRILRALVREIDEADIPETERRALDGDR